MPALTRGISCLATVCQVDQIDGLLKKYEGKEQALIDGVKEKYKEIAVRAVPAHDCALTLHYMNLKSIINVYHHEQLPHSLATQAKKAAEEAAAKAATEEAERLETEEMLEDV